MILGLGVCVVFVQKQKKSFQVDCTDYQKHAIQDPYQLVEVGCVVFQSMLQGKSISII